MSRSPNSAILRHVIEHATQMQPTFPANPLATTGYIEFKEKCLRKDAYFSELTVILGGGQPFAPIPTIYISCRGGKGFNQWRAHTDNIVGFAFIDFSLLPLVVCQNYTHSRQTQTDTAEGCLVICGHSRPHMQLFFFFNRDPEYQRHYFAIITDINSLNETNLKQTSGMSGLVAISNTSIFL